MSLPAWLASGPRGVAPLPLVSNTFTELPTPFVPNGSNTVWFQKSGV